MHPLLTRFAPLAVIAVAGLAVASWTAFSTVRPKTVPALAQLPPQGPWVERISASGLIEGDGNNTIVGVPEPALVTAVAVQVGQQVAMGDLLFRLDDRTLLADLAVAEADLAVALGGKTAAQTELARLQALPRADDAGPAMAQVGVAKAQLTLARTRRGRLERLGERGSESELEDAKLAESIALALVGTAEAALMHIRLPAFPQDILVAARRVESADATVAAANARVAAVRTHLSRLEIRAPRAGTVITATVMVGALAAPGDANLVVLADLHRLLVRVEIDESQIWKWKPGRSGQGWLRGDRSKPLELHYERIEPQAAARRAVLGKPGERLDGRAMQVLYQLIAPPAYLRPGLLLEVDLDATP